MRLTIIRHAEAGDRHTWVGDDAERPLSERGLAQAVALADMIEADGSTRLMSSPYQRCLETLAPLAARTGAEIESESQLGEAASAFGVLELLATLLDAGDHVVLCSHGNIIPVLLDGCAQRGLVERQVWRCQKGSTWIFVPGEPGRTRYLPPPA